MKHLILFFILITGIAFQSCKEQSKPATIPLSYLIFSSIFAQSKKDSMHAYCLLGSGYFRAPTSSNADSIINDWLSRHPNADVIPVASHGPTLTDFPNSRMTYCWLIDKTDTLNNFLIRNGCFPGGTMTRPKTWKEMSDEEKGIWENDANLIVHINKGVYESFLDQIEVAEKYARQNHLGIWKDEEVEY